MRATNEFELRIKIVRVVTENGKAKHSIWGTPLLVDVERGHIEIARLLAEKGADIDKAKTDNGGTPFLHCFPEKDTPRREAPPRERRGRRHGERGQTGGLAPLFTAVERGHV